MGVEKCCARTVHVCVCACTFYTPEKKVISEGVCNCNAMNAISPRPKKCTPRKRGLVRARTGLCVFTVCVRLKYVGPKGGKVYVEAKYPVCKTDEKNLLTYDVEPVLFALLGLGVYLALVSARVLGLGVP